jgi:diguanylate cyclase (GGDEF)-like protein
MAMAALPLLLAQVLVLLALLGGAAAGLRAAPGWRHDRRRFLLAVLGAAACLAAALPAAAALFGAEPATGWRAALRLLPDAALPLVFVALLRSLRRADRNGLEALTTAPVNPQTSLPNRALLIGQALPALARCQRDRTPAAVLVAALDDAGAIVARRGPAAMQEALHGFAGVFRDATRAGDVPGHARPQVLAALLPATTPEAARALAERLRSEAGARLAHPDMDGRRLTVSVGIAPVGEGATRAVLDEALEAAEAAMARAHAAGGGQVAEAQPPPGRSAGPLR